VLADFLRNYIKLEIETDNLNMLEPDKDKFINLPKITTKILKVFEMYRNSLFAQSSDGWFFDDISRIEPIQVMRYALRTIQLIKDIESKDTGTKLEENFVKAIEQAKSNIEEFGNGKNIFNKYVKTSEYNFKKIATHFAFEALNGKKLDNIFCYEIEHKKINNFFKENFKITTGIIKIKSRLTLEKHYLLFCAYLFDLNNEYKNFNTNTDNKIEVEIKNNWPVAFIKIYDSSNDLNCSSNEKDMIIQLNTLTEKIEEISHNFDGAQNDFIQSQIRLKKNLDELMYQYFNTEKELNFYTIKDLIKDNQVKLMQGLISNETEKIKPLLEKLFENYEEIIKDFKQSKIINYFLDGIFTTTEEFIGEIMLYYVLKQKEVNEDIIKNMKKIIDKINTIDFINRETFNNLSTEKIDSLASKFALTIESIFDKSKNIET